MKSPTSEEMECMRKAIEGQNAVAKALASDVERLFYARMRKYKNNGQSPAASAQSAIDEMNRDPWGTSEKP